MKPFKIYFSDEAFPLSSLFLPVSDNTDNIFSRLAYDEWLMNNLKVGLNRTTRRRKRNVD